MDPTKNVDFIGNSLKNIKNKNILKTIIGYLDISQTLKLLQYNNFLQKKVDIGISTYRKHFNEIVIEMIPIDNPKAKDDDKNFFINIPDQYKNFYHIYFDEHKQEENRNYIINNEQVNKIKIIIDEEVKSFENLFANAYYIETINFIKFNRKDITDMSGMFFMYSTSEKNG